MKSSTSKILTLFRQGFVYSTGNFLNKILLFLMVPLFAEFILPADLSLLEILDPAEQFVYGVLNMGLVHAFYRFYNKQQSREYQCQVISTLFWFLAVIAVVAILVFYAFSEKITDILLPAHTLAKVTFLLTLVSLFIRFFSLIASGFFNATEQATKYSFWVIVGTVLYCSYNFYFLAFRGANIDAVFEARIFSLLPLTLAGIWAFRSSVTLTFNAGMLSQMLKFSYPFILSASAYPILNYADRWMLSEIVNPDATGIYGMSYRFGMVPGMLLVQPFLKAWRPFIYNYDDKETRQVVYQRILIYYTLVGGILWLGLSVFSRELILLFTSEPYYSGHVIIPFVAASQLFYGLGWIVVAGLAVKDKTFFIGFYTFIAGIINILLNLIWIPEYGILGAAYATLASFIFIFLGYAGYSYYKLKLSWPFVRLSSMILLLGLSYVTISSISTVEFYTGIFYKSLGLLVPIILLFFIAGFNIQQIKGLYSILFKGDD